MVVKFNSKVFGGLPVVVEAEVYPAEPDVGYPYEYANVIRVLFKNGREFTDKLYDKLTKLEWAILEEEALAESRW